MKSSMESFWKCENCGSETSNFIKAKNHKCEEGGRVK